jgi:hypothetical protein
LEPNGGGTDWICKCSRPQLRPLPSVVQKEQITHAVTKTPSRFLALGGHSERGCSALRA